jgi:hypothetical protein
MIRPEADVRRGMAPSILYIHQWENGPWLVPRDPVLWEANQGIPVLLPSAPEIRTGYHNYSPPIIELVQATPTR